MADFTDEMKWFLENYCLEFWPILLFHPPIQILLSIMQYLAPELVLPLNMAGDGKSKKFKVKAFNEKWAWAERRWTQVT